MKRKNREINIFSMSALDLFASALGAFMLIALMSLPYFLRDNDEELTTELQQQVEQLQADSARIQAELELVQVQNRQLEEQLKVNFLIVIIKWELKQDIDLHVSDPQGREYFYRQRTHPGSQAILSRDAVDGPGIETWEFAKVTPGEYKIHYNFYEDKGGGPLARVSGSIYYRGGSKEIPDVMLTKLMGKKLMAIAKVSSSGNVSILIQ